MFLFNFYEKTIICVVLVKKSNFDFVNASLSQITWGSQSSYEYRSTSVPMEDGNFRRDVPVENRKLVHRTC